MKQIKFFLILLFLISNVSCKKDVDSQQPSTNNGTIDNTNTAGSVRITASWNTTYGSCNYAFSMVVGIGYSSNDISNNAFFAQGNYFTSPFSFVQGGLQPGIYYYKATKKYSTNCGTMQGVPDDVIRTGSFTVVAGQTKNVEIGHVN